MYQISQKKKKKVLQLLINYAPHLNFKKVIISYNYFPEKISPPHLTHPPTLPNSINPKTHHKMRKKKKSYPIFPILRRSFFFIIFFRIFFLNRCDMGLNLSESWQQVNFKYEWCSKNTGYSYYNRIQQHNTYCYWYSKELGIKQKCSTEFKTQKPNRREHQSSITDKI